MCNVRYISTHAFPRYVYVAPGDEVHLNDRYKVELLPYRDYSGMTISHDGHDLVLKFSLHATIKIHLR